VNASVAAGFGSGVVGGAAGRTAGATVATGCGRVWIDADGGVVTVEAGGVAVTGAGAGGRAWADRVAERPRSTRGGRAGSALAAGMGINGGLRASTMRIDAARGAVAASGRLDSHTTANATPAASIATTRSAAGGCFDAADAFARARRAYVVEVDKGPTVMWTSSTTAVTSAQNEATASNSVPQAFGSAWKEEQRIAEAPVIDAPERSAARSRAIR
jgi:hypothetical protein